MSGWQVGIDIGGTFTDLVALLPSSGEVRSIKVPTQRNDPVASILAALAAAGLTSEEVDDLIHGTTLVTNAIVEDRVDPVALVTTRGFEDVLDIGRGGRQHLYRLDLPPRRASQVPADRRVGLAERVDSHRRGRAGARRSAIADAVARVKATGVESVAVSLFHAYANPAHERAVGAGAGGGAAFRLAVARGQSRDARVRAHGDDRAQRLGDADRRPLSRPPAARSERRAPARHAFGGRHGLARGCSAAAARHGAVRPGRRRFRGGPRRGLARARQGSELRHGRHDDRCLLDHRRRGRDLHRIPSSPAGRCASPWSPSNRSAPAADRW